MRACEQFVNAVLCVTSFQLAFGRSLPTRLKTVINLVCVIDVLGVLQGRSVAKEERVRLLVIEDEPRIAEILKKGHERAGFVVDVVRLCNDAKEALAVTPYDAAILDLGLPDNDGLELLAHLRPRSDRIPILVLTARDAVEDRIAGLDAGA